MPKKKPGMTPEQQSEAFREKVRELIDAGELDPTEAAERFDRAVSGAKTQKVDPDSP